MLFSSWLFVGWIIYLHAFCFCVDGSNSAFPLPSWVYRKTVLPLTLLQSSICDICHRFLLAAGASTQAGLITSFSQPSSVKFKLFCLSFFLKKDDDFPQEVNLAKGHLGFGGSTISKAAFLQHGTWLACEHPVRACCQASLVPAEDAMGAMSCNERPIFAPSSYCSQRARTISSSDAFSRLMDSATSWLTGLFLGLRLHSICRWSLCQWHMAQ